MKKKNIFLGLASIVLLSACSSDEMTFTGNENVNPDQISFANPYIGKSDVTTRATGDITSTNIKSTTLKVWAESYEGETYDAASATNIMDSVRLSFADEKWQYDGSKYWDGDKKHDFIGFAPADAAATADYSNGVLTLTGVPAVQVISNGDTKSGDDYLVSVAETTTREESGWSGVGLDFKHILSRLTFYVLSTDNSYDVKLNSMKVYLPSEAVAVNYNQTAHADPAGSWTWDGFTSVPSASSESELTASGYAGYDVLAAADDAIDVEKMASATKTPSAKMATEFFIAPHTNASAYYMKVNYTVNVGAVERTLNKFVKIDGLTAFQQGYQYSLLVNLNPSLITFSVESNLDWTDDDKFVKGEPPVPFTAAASGLHISGDISGYVNTNTYKVSKLVKTSTTDNLLIRPTGSEENTVQLTVESDGHYRLSTQHINLDKLESGATYEMTMIACQNGEPLEENTVADIVFTFDEMNFTIDPGLVNSTNEFCMPMPLDAAVSGHSFAFAWGDNNSSLEIGENGDVSSLTSEQRAHTYATTGDMKVRVLTTQTDRTSPQIPEFNFSKYPIAIIDSIWNHNGSETIKHNNSNPNFLKSVNTPVLYSGSTNLNGMFFWAENMTSVNSDLLSLYTDAVEMRGIFMARINTNFTIPEGLFDQNTQVQYFDGAFSSRNITTLPDSLFYKNTEVVSFANTFGNNTSLNSIPDGFFSKNLKAYNFFGTFTNCINLVSFENMFIGNGQTIETRFANLDHVLDLSRIFYWVGSFDETGAASNNAIDFSLYTYKSGYGYTWKDDYCSPYKDAATFANQNAIDNLSGDHAEDCGGVAYPY